MKVTATEVVTKTIDGVTLDMSFEDAQVLLAIVGQIGGPSTLKGRKFINRLYMTLQNAGIVPAADVHLTLGSAIQPESRY